MIKRAVYRSYKMETQP